MSLDAELIEAYCRTTYEIHSPSRVIGVRLGETSSALDELLGAADVSHWAILSADNPASTPLSDEENAIRREALIAAVRAAEVGFWLSSTVADDGRWPSEHGLCLLRPERSQALEWGREFRQHALVWGAAGVAPILIFPFVESGRAALEGACLSDDPRVREIASASLAEIDFRE